MLEKDLLALYIFLLF